MTPPQKPNVDYDELKARADELEAENRTWIEAILGRRRRLDVAEH
jgi:hypothetical protein